MNEHYITQVVQMLYNMILDDSAQTNLQCSNLVA